MGVMERCTRGAPCIFCGDVGYDMRVHYPETGDVVHWCHKTKKNGVAQGDLITAGGETFICIASRHRGARDIGEFDLFKKYLPKEAWMEKQKATNPNWNSGRKERYTRVKKCSEVIDYASSKPAKGECEVLPAKELDRIYRKMLSLLVLEDKHRKDFLKEWESPVHDVTRLLDIYPIRSFPPQDSVRFKLKEKFKNPTRKRLISELLKEFGDLRGVPGFYLRGGDYWKDKPESERWTISSPEGVIFPCYDKDGYLYRIRVKDDYPDYIIKKEKNDAPINGQWGTLHHSYDKETGEHLWNLLPKTEGEGEAHASFIIYGRGIQLISLNGKGQPTVGKVNGKYKNISSVSTKYENYEFVNTMEGGSRSGSPYSLYCSPGDSYLVVLGTEGEKKGMVGNYIRHNPLVSTAGVWCFEALFDKDEKGVSLIDTLKARGMKVFVLCYDADKDKNDDVRAAEAAFVERLKEENVMPMIGNWKSRFDKGLDDILLMGLDISVAHV